MDSTTMLKKDQILTLNVGEFYNLITKEEYERIYNIMSKNFYETVKEEHYLNAFLEFFKATAKTYKDTDMMSVQMFIDIFIDELNKKG
ncbi:MAG: hypothetical protein HFJ17_01630 [Clostridia bacterium]|jgi:hypothetical protein|nr:hypothetical protein [Clostridia bacterium]